MARKPWRVKSWSMVTRARPILPFGDGIHKGQIQSRQVVVGHLQVTQLLRLQEFRQTSITSLCQSSSYRRNAGSFSVRFVI